MELVTDGVYMSRLNMELYSQGNVEFFTSVQLSDYKNTKLCDMA